MCHAAIVAREYGLPAVVGTGVGTKRIKTGDRLRLDADAGVVGILDRTEAPAANAQTRAPSASQSTMAQDMAAAVIGREEELGAIRAFLSGCRRVRALVLSGEAGIGKTILWEAGVEEAASAYGRVLLTEGPRPKPRSPSPGSRICLPRSSTRWRLAGPLRRRALEVALLLAEPGERPPDPARDRARAARRPAGSAERGPVDRRARRRPMARFVLGGRAPDCPSPPAERADRCARHPAAGHPTWRPRSSSSARSRRTRLDPRLARPAEPGRASSSARGATRARPHAAGVVRVQEARREPVLRARARARARSDEHEARGRPGLAGVREPARAPRRTPRAVADGDRRRGALRRCACAADDRAGLQAHGEPASVLEALRHQAGGCLELDDSRIRFSHPLLASISYEQAPPWKRRAIHGALAEAVTDVEEKARHLALSVDGPDAVVASHLDAAAEQAPLAGRLVRRRSSPSLLPSSRLPIRRTPGNAASERRTFIVLPVRASGRLRCSSSSSPMFRPALSGPTSSSSWSRRTEATSRC